MNDTGFYGVDKKNLVGSEGSLIRHELRKSVTSSSIEKISKEFELDKELGLTKQARITAQKSLREDIDELTKSNDYYEVTREMLEKLFRIKSMDWACFWRNTLSSLLAFFIKTYKGAFIMLLPIMTLDPLLKYSSKSFKAAHPNVVPSFFSFEVLMAGICIVLWLVAVVLFFWGLSICFSGKISYLKMEVKLSVKDLFDVDEKIPYGAKLKVLEAKKTNIFEGFVYVKPEFELEEVLKEINILPKPKVLDPAILGVTRDKRMYMIVYWDIEKDIEKTFKKIEDLKKFKLNAIERY